MSYSELLGNSSSRASGYNRTETAANAGITEDRSAAGIQNSIARNDREAKESLQSTIQALQETDEISRATSSQLAHQQEQLNRTKRDAELVDKNLDARDEILGNMKSFWGKMKHAWFGDEDPNAPTATSRMLDSMKETVGMKDTNPRAGATASNATSSTFGTSNTSKNTASNGNFNSSHQNSSGSMNAPRIKPLPPKTAPPRASQNGMCDVGDDFDEELDAIQDMLGDLKDRTKVIHHTIKSQVKDTDRLNDQSATAQDRYNKQRHDLKKAMGEED